MNYSFNTPRHLASQNNFFGIEKKKKSPPPFKHNKSGKYAAPRRNAITGFRLRSRISPVSSIINATEAPAAGRGWLMSSSPPPSSVPPSFPPSAAAALLLPGSAQHLSAAAAAAADSRTSTRRRTADSAQRGQLSRSHPYAHFATMTARRNKQMGL